MKYVRKFRTVNKSTITKLHYDMLPNPEFLAAAGENVLRPELKRPLDPASMGNDAAVLRGLVGDMNAMIVSQQVDPTLVAATVRAQEKQRTPIATPAVEPPVNRPAGPVRLMFTGRSLAGKHWLANRLGARIIDVYAPIKRTIASYLGASEGPGFAALADEIRAWGAGLVSPQFPLTSVRLLFVKTLRQSAEWGFFGRPNFWADYALSVASAQDAKQSVVIIGVDTPEQYKAVLEAKFVPFHVMASNASIAARGTPGVQSPLSNHLDNSAIKQVSQQPTGERMRCVWNDNSDPRTNRFWSVDQFISQFAPGSVEQQSAIDIQVV